MKHTCVHSDILEGGNINQEVSLARSKMSVSGFVLKVGDRVWPSKVQTMETSDANLEGMDKSTKKLYFLW